MEKPLRPNDPRIFELICGLATALAALHHYFFFDLPELARARALNPARPDDDFLLIVLAPGLLIGIGAALHALKSMLTGLALVIAGGALYLFYYFFAFLSALYFKGFVGAIIYALPGIAAFATMILAFRVNDYLEEYSEQVSHQRFLRRRV